MNHSIAMNKNFADVLIVKTNGPIHLNKQEDNCSGFMRNIYFDVWYGKGLGVWCKKRHKNSYTEWEEMYNKYLYMYIGK